VGLSSKEEGMKKFNLDFFFHAGLLGLLLVFIGISTTYPFESRVYPQALCTITSILIIASLIRHFLQKSKHKDRSADGASSRRKFYEVMLVMIVATGIGLMGGFLLSIVCYYVGYALLQENRSGLPKTLGIGFALTAVYYLLFGWVMEVPLFRGWILHF
jgi:membrane protease YdiL (CAAX protease family)